MLCRISNGVRILNEKLLGSRLNSRALKYGTNSFSILEVIRTSIFAVHANFDYCVQLVLDAPLRMRVARPTVEIARRDSFSLGSALDAVSWLDTEQLVIEL